MPVTGLPPAARRSRHRVEPSGNATRWGITSRSIAASSARRAASSASRIRARERASSRVVRSSSATCSASSASRAVLRKATAVWSASAVSSRSSESDAGTAPGHVHLDAAQDGAAVPDRYDVRDGALRRGVAPGRAVGRRTRDPQGGGRPPSGDRPAGGLRDGRQDRVRGRRLGEAAAEVREGLVGLGSRAEGEPVGQPGDLPPERLEGERDQCRRQQGQPEPAGPTCHQVPDRDDERGVADPREGRADREDDGPVDDHLDVVEPVAQHRDREQDRQQQVGDVERERRRPGLRAAVEELNDEERDEADADQGGRRGDQTHLLALPRPAPGATGAPWRRARRAARC